MNDKDVDFEAMVKGTHTPTIRRKGIEVKEYQSLFVKSINEEKRQITALASSGGIDRHREIVKPSAFKKSLAGYMENPVILACHQHRLTDGRSPVVGSAVKAWIDKGGLWIVVEFAETELGKEYWLLYSKKHQRAFSIGFTPIKSEEKKIDGERVCVHTEVELFEISCVPVPANREALSRSAKRKADFVAGKQLEKFNEEYRELAELERLNKRYETWRDTPEDERKWQMFTDEECRLFADWEKAGEELAEALLGSESEYETPAIAESLPESKGSDTEHDYAGIVSGTVEYDDTMQKSYSDLVGG